MGKYTILSLIIALTFSLCATEELPEESSEFVSWNPRTPTTSQLQTLKANAPSAAKTKTPVRCHTCTTKHIAAEPKNRLQIGGNYTYAHIRPSGKPSRTGNLG